MPQKHDNYTRKVFDGIGEGGGGVVKVITRTACAFKNIPKMYFSTNSKKICKLAKFIISI
jgi:hypothetical protein